MPKFLKKEKLNLLMLIALVTGNMVGSGIFMLPADFARIGSISLLSWIFSSAGVILLALVFAKMSAIFPKTGGPYAYTHLGFGNFMGFQTAYIYWLMVLFGNAAVAVASIGYLQTFFPVLANPYLGTLVTLSEVWLFTLINIRGVRTVGIIQIITTILKFVPLLIVGILGWMYFHPEYITQNFNVSHKSNFSAFSYASILIFWVFIGLETGTIPAGSVENPRRNIPMATILGTLIAAVIYIASTTALMGMIHPRELMNSTSPFAEAMKLMFGTWGGRIAALGAIISCLGVLNGWTLIQGQMPMAAAKDKLFPKFFAKCNKHDVPALGIIASSVIISIMLIITTSKSLIDQFNILISAATVIALLTYMYTAIAEIILLPKRNIPHIIIASLAACYSFWVIFGSGQEIVFYMTMLVFTSIPLYIGIKYKLKK